MKEGRKGDRKEERGKILEKERDVPEGESSQLSCLQGGALSTL
jgi:hypothetical protein